MPKKITPQMERDGHYKWIDRRREKRLHRMNPSVIAYYEGQDAAEMAAPNNPYPPGVRHDEWQRGFDAADPMGNWHGRNE